MFCLKFHKDRVDNDKNTAWYNNLPDGFIICLKDKHRIISGGVYQFNVESIANLKEFRKYIKKGEGVVAYRIEANCVEPINLFLLDDALNLIKKELK